MSDRGAATGKATIASLTTLSGIGDRAIYYKPAGSSIGNALVAKGDAGIWIQTNADEAQVRKPAAIAVARL